MKVDLNKILITGGNGMVGSYIDFGIKADRESFDITKISEVVDFVSKLKPTAILHLAAETDTTKCEADPTHAYLVNAVGTYNLAIAAKEVGAKMVYVSTDAVFSHSKMPHKTEAEVEPDGVYGHSKYFGELAVKGISNNYIIVRTSWVFGGKKGRDKKFVGKFIPQLNNAEATAVNDQFSSPTYARDLVDGLKRLILEEKVGIYHVVNSGVASRYDMAVVIAKILNKETKIKPVSATTFGLLPYQESSGGLVGNVGMRSWQDALTDYLKTEW